MSQIGLTAPPPPFNPFTDEDWTRIEEQLRQCYVVKQGCERCKRCNIPIQQLEADCDSLVAFFQGLQKEFRGQQAPFPGPPAGP